jgi:hypothetical protein
MSWFFVLSVRWKIFSAIALVLLLTLGAASFAT